MPAPLAVDQDQVRMLVLEFGPREAARRCNLKEGTVLQWCKRGGWLADKSLVREAVQGQQTPARAELAATLPVSMRPQAVIGVINPADAMAEALAEDEKATRISLSRAARNLASQAESAELSQSGDALQAGKLAALVHRWQDGSSGNAAVINVLSSVSLTVEQAGE